MDKINLFEVFELSPRTIEAMRDKLKIKTGTKSTAVHIMFALNNKLLNQRYNFT